MAPTQACAFSCAVPTSLNRNRAHFGGAQSVHFTSRRGTFRWTCALKPKKASRFNHQVRERLQTHIHQRLQQSFSLLRKDFDRLHQRIQHFTVRNVDNDHHDKQGDRRSLQDDNNTSMSAIEDDTKSTEQVEMSSKYRPRSVMGQAVAQGFSSLRGSMERTIDIARLNAKQALQTVANMVFSVAVKILPALPTAVGGKSQAGWRLLPSLRWQSPLIPLQKANSLRTNVQVNFRDMFLKAQRYRAAFLNSRNTEQRALQLVQSSVANFGRLLGGMGNSFRGTVSRSRPRIGSMNTKSRQLQKSVPLKKEKRLRKQGSEGRVLTTAGIVVAVGGVMTGVPLSTVVSCTALVATSVGVVSGRINNGAPAGQLGKQSKGLKESNMSQWRSTRRQETYIPPSVMNQAPKRLVQRSDGMVNGKDEMKWEVIRGGNSMMETESGKIMGNESVETSSYSIEGSKPWLVSVPFFGDTLKTMDSTAFLFEKFMTTVMRIFGISRGKDRVEGGWRILRSLQRN